MMEMFTLAAVLEMFAQNPDLVFRFSTWETRYRLTRRGGLLVKEDTALGLSSPFFPHDGEWFDQEWESVQDLRSTKEG